MILRSLVKKGIMHRKYPNSYMMNRISGTAFDISITAALLLISVVALGTLWVPVLLISTVGGLVSIVYLRRLCTHIYKDYSDEAFLVFYGNLTGTIANGMILLREIDKGFETPASDDIVVGSSAAIIMGFPLLLLIAQAPRDGNLWWVSLALIVYFLALTFYQTKDLLFKKKQ
jgi:ESS family glutamate:Na+ symporter